MDIETLLTILVISVIATCISRIIGGWTIAGILASFLLACLGAIGGWIAQQRLGLPALYSISFPSDHELVPVIWPALGALLAGLVGSLFGRPVRPQRRARRR